ncbi:MAG TPA: helix-turn-helix domain-containing protein [Ilumatobacteraceae bacterium]
MSNEALRSEQMALTRTRIIDAVFELMAEGHPAAISIPEVSRRSGVSIATIYRHFPNKEQLLEATAFAGVTPRDELLRRDPDPDNFGPYLETTWSEMAGIEPMLRAQYSTRLGHDVRKRRTRDRDAIAVEVLAGKGFDPDRDETRRLARVAAMLGSSAVYLDQLDLPRRQAIGDLAWAVKALTDATRQAIDGTPPPVHARTKHKATNASKEEKKR